ncbi:phosphoglycerate dehydrogenase [Aerococcus sp. Group 2]|uniref:phosphoglycerate dehydrogenase n=1 Tax=Aerococcus sp. Group 2 TaxID=2976811 RepID=UPI00227B0AD4|nr:phosphoglycerate dehydrogenase [Aerococcus sp. Group 2]MCY3039692.1 phosphoglycerate dehydrogenase [Aerococcus sp. Group 2]MCY3043149.1 phosphoglycerate dehydrogenase [Aerococcus sp. Group 2]
MAKVLITPRSFAKYNKEEIVQLFEEADIEPIFNETGTIYTEEKLIESVSDVDGIIVGVDPITENVINNAPKLKTIAKYGVGIDNINVELAKEKDITITRTIGANASAVADYDFALLMAVARRVVEINNAAKEKIDWSKKMALDIYGKKIGILGLGATGRETVKRAQGFAMDIYGYDIYEDKDYIKENNIHFTQDLTTIFKECDFISIHIPLTKDTHYLINKDLFAIAKPNLVLTNTARGGIINEKDLYEALANKQIFGAGIDAFEQEPLEDSPLLGLENLIIGTHTAASSVGASEQMTFQATQNVISEIQR